MVGAAYIGSLPAFGFNSILVLKRKVERGKRKEEMIWFWEPHSNLFPLSSFSISSFPSLASQRDHRVTAGGEARWDDARDQREYHADGYKRRAAAKRQVGKAL